MRKFFVTYQFASDSRRGVGSTIISIKNECKVTAEFMMELNLEIARAGNLNWANIVFMRESEE